MNNKADGWAKSKPANITLGHAKAVEMLENEAAFQKTRKLYDKVMEFVKLILYYFKMLIVLVIF